MTAIKSVLAITLIALAGTASGAGPQPIPGVNYDDPNLAVTNDYATDSATSCPKSLKGKRLRECLIKMGLAPVEEISENAETLTVSAPRSLH